MWPALDYRTAVPAILLSLLVGIASQAATPVRLEFNRDVRPILSDTCFHCHGPDKNARKAGMRLDIRDEALKPAKSGKAPVVPGKPEESEFVKRLFTADGDDLMPPPEAHKPLTAGQKETLRRWIAEGAEYQPHWSYVAPKRPAVPPVQSSGFKVQGSKFAGSNPIDAFIRAKLTEKQLDLSPEADRRTLLRRLSLDLIGLPPTTAEMEAFLRDKSANAYEKQVDRLLKSPHYGERMTVPWLDLVRFSDTVGYHGDQNANVFPYRDYVIESFNRNQPFDQFTREQLAGDLLPDPTVEQRVATGFNRLNMMTREGGAQPGEYLAKYGADRVRTVAMTWLGSTMGCAECHDHKFDPFTSRDFYSLKAFFADVKQWGVYNDYDYTPNPDLRGWSNDHPFPPEIEVESPYLKRRAAKLAAEMDTVATQVAAHAQVAAWETEAKEFLKRHPLGWLQPKPEFINTITNASISADGDVLLPDKPKDGNVQLRLALEPGWLAAIRVELLPEGTNGITRGGGGTSLRPAFALVRGTSKPVELGFHHAEANLDEPRYANGYEIIGVRDNWRTSGKRVRERHEAVWVLNEPRRVEPGDALTVNLRNDQVVKVRIAVTPFAAANPLRSGANVELTDALAKPAKERSAAERALLSEAWLLGTDGSGESRKQFQELHWELLNCRNGSSPTMVTAAWEPTTTRVLARGNWMDESGEIVSPNPPAFLPRAGLPSDRRLTRLDLAEWLVSSENPLTARVFVNRLWKQFFGNALSAQVEDLGAQGEAPSHPELLDWLSVEFRESGWDAKHMVRLLVTSATYKQGSNLRPELRDADPNNRLLASQNPRRLEAEFVRDNALFVAGLLNLDLGGPSAFPYQPGGYYVNLQFPDRDYVPNRDEQQYRRGLYAHWQRTFLNPMLANFDAPAREECTATRTVSNTPQQALTLLNDPAFVEASRAFAERLLRSEPRDDSARLDAAFRLALGRPAKTTETNSLTKFLAEQRAYYGANAEDAKRFLHVGNHPVPAGANEPELAAWTQVARVVLNLHETITRY